MKIPISILFLTATLILYGNSQTKIVSVNVNTNTGVPKNLLGVNVGPGNSVQGYNDCGITEIRTHDYYGPCDYWTYTVGYIDTATRTINYSFNPNLTSSYNWLFTDYKVDSIANQGFRVYFRLGISWPNTPGVPTFPPVDASQNTFETFSEVCKRTVMHYTQGWNNGRNYVIPYWEIWNEPDFTQKFWSGPNGTPMNYYVMYKTVALKIKSVNNQFKVGGPGVAYSTMLFSSRDYRENFVSYCQANSVPLDFYSWHLYDTRNPFALKAYGDTIRNILNSRGFTNAESHITEIHPGLEGTVYNNTPRGAAWIVSAFITCNYSHIDKFFWYRGTLLGALVEPDNGGNPVLRWNGYGYKAYSDFYKTAKTLVQHTGDEFITTNFTEDVLSFLTLGGKSLTGDTICVLISNLNSSYSNIQVNISSIPWEGNTKIEQYTIKGPSDRFTRTVVNTNVSGGSLTYAISNAQSPSAYYLKVIKNTSIGIVNNGSSVAGNGFSVYPNPFNANLFLNLNKNQTLRIYNILGQEISRLYLNEGLQKIDTKLFVPGIYFISNGESIIRIIKK